MSIIILPSAVSIVFSTYGIGEWFGIGFIGVPYLASMINTLRLLVLVAFTDPGIVPRIQNSEIRYEMRHKVVYREADEI